MIQIIFFKKENYFSFLTMNNETVTPKEIELESSYSLALILLLTGIALTVWKATVGIVITVIALFLLIQTVIIKLKFTSTALDVYRQQTRIRSFPYSEWQNWLIISSAIPVLFYFKEVKSIHFLPILFNANQLKYCLEKYCSKPNLNKNDQKQKVS